MRINSRYLAVTMCLALASLELQASGASASAQNTDLAVTATSGESWLNHVHRSFGDTSMGKTGRLGPPPPAEGQVAAGWQLGLAPPSNQPLELHGSDLYRLNCQACHGEAGLGAPPEINSVINPVRATSVPLILDRMKKSGLDMTPTAAEELARQSQDALVQRLHIGGKDMPPFPHLSEPEIRALIAYLKQLSGVPGVTQLTVSETPLRIGEHIVKSTCHTCHDATGQNPSPEELENGAIPPLETLPVRTDELQLIRKVTSGAPIVMGTPAIQHRGRMPVFFYLSREEAADVYLYLTTYPPVQLAASPALVTASQQDGMAGGAPNFPAPAVRPPTAGQTQTRSQTQPRSQSDGIPDVAVTLALIGFVALAIGASAGGFGFAAYELCRLARAAQKSKICAAAPAKTQQEAAQLTVR